MSTSTTQLARKQSGFTLVEMMVTIAVLAIIVSIAAPSFSTQLAQGQAKTTAALIQTSISKAKAESTISRNNVTWTYDSLSKTITLTNGTNTVANYTLNSNSALTFTPATATTLMISKEGIIRMGGAAANVIIDVGDLRTSTTTDRRVRVNTKRAFECSGTNC